MLRVFFLTMFVDALSVLLPCLLLLLLFLLVVLHLLLLVFVHVYLAITIVVIERRTRYWILSLYRTILMFMFVPFVMMFGCLICIYI